MPNAFTAPAGLLSGQVAFITGGAGGIGQAVAHAFLAQGASVIIADIEPARLADASAALGGGTSGRLRTVTLDVTDEAATAAAVATAGGAPRPLKEPERRHSLYDSASRCEKTL